MIKLFETKKGQLDIIGGINNFISSAPPPVQFIIFIFIIMFAGLLVNGFFQLGSKSCLKNDASQWVIIDTKTTDICQDVESIAWALKNNITENQGVIYGDPSISYQNLSIWDKFKNFFSWVNPNSWAYYKQTGNPISYLLTIKDFKDNGYSWVQAINLYNNPANFYCDYLYQCIKDNQGSQNMTAKLGLYPNCNITNVPEIGIYINVTKQNGSIKDNRGSFNNPFGDTCEFGSDYIKNGVSYRLVTPTFFGFEFLNFRYWLIIMLIGILFSFAFVWYANFKG